MTLESAKELDRRCVWYWLNDVYRNPTVAFNTYSDEQLIELAHDALVLLKEQEPIEPITLDGDDLYWQPGDEDYACGACGEELAGSWWVYCPYCGRKVKWE